ncbi:IclR family transcriptional regulator [Halogeometricum luteum]|uniref:Helix-turn-helix domain-containing protein n=1 Tax=Halogeometricum luteum TaxID=2950537 RepID=A0ABU2G4G7_9EURY|nr:IclR family transcriptional regulator C-terminal domain-containing protein [Halogeometricum sp. S3BR5-2]MDS0295189.1 helix-turn-helix domain-containing protein [Halogeometricum sp. S3BR5-2]
MSHESEYTVEATKTSLTLLEALVDADAPMGVTPLAERVGSSKSVVHNHLSTLRTCGYVTKEGDAYRPSLRTLNLGVRTRERSAVYRVAAPSLDNLAAATGETAVLFVAEERWGVPAYVAERPSGRRPAFEEGDRFPLSATAPGKSILASLSEDRVAEVLDATELPADTDVDELRREIRRIRDDGVAFCREEQFEGVVGVAAPIESGADRTPAALSVYGPSDRLRGRHLEEDVTGQVLSTAKSIQVELASE